MEQTETPINLAGAETTFEADLAKAKEEVNSLYLKMRTSIGTPGYAEHAQKHAAALEEYRKIGRQQKPSLPPAESTVTENERQYTLEDYEREKNWDSGFGSNNPGAFERQMKEHSRRLREIRTSLIAQGLLEKTETEKITEILDGLYPNAKSKTIVMHEGKKYQIRYFPLEKSNSGKTVHAWGNEWLLIEEEQK